RSVTLPALSQPPSATSPPGRATGSVRSSPTAAPPSASRPVPGGTTCRPCSTGWPAHPGPTVAGPPTWQAHCASSTAWHDGGAWWWWSATSSAHLGGTGPCEPWRPARTSSPSRWSTPATSRCPTSASSPSWTPRRAGTSRSRQRTAGCAPASRRLRPPSATRSPVRCGSLVPTTSSCAPTVTGSWTSSASSTVGDAAEPPSPRAVRRWSR
ncbi:MAG: hypothetical protein PA3071, partial [uncultured Acidimicrobiales bacterium]